MTVNNRFYQQGYTDGWRYYARDYHVFAGHRAVRVMTAEERCDYDRGYKAGKSHVNGARLVALGYEA